jgi:diguanylate cyclase (GGDEF)-like protein/PAS domain S-box-containing protein
MFRWLFLNDRALSPAEHMPWKISALRIILLSGFVLEASIAIQSSLDAIHIGAYQVVAIVIVFYGLLGTALYFSARHPDHGAGLLIATVYAAGASIVLFVRVDEIAKMGFVFVYTTPIIARLFFGGRLAVTLMLFNFLPFYYLLRNEPLVHYDAFDITLQSSYSHIHSLLFLFFNVCIPLAVFRVLHALDTTAGRFRETSSALADSHAQYREFFESAGGPILLCGADGSILQANRLARDLIRASDSEQHSGTSLFELLHPADTTAVALREISARGGLEAVEGQPLRTPDGRTLILEYITRMASNHYVVTLRDASSLRLMEEALQRSRDREAFLSGHDTLTRLPNRETLCRHLADVLPLLEGGKVKALLTFRLNSIRHANEKFGTRIGDELIRSFAGELRKTLPSSAFCARLRSIVFAAVLTPTRSANDVMRQVEHLRKSLPREIEIEGNKLLVQFSTGISLAKSGDISPDELIRRSEVALDSARRSNEDSAALFDEADATQIRRSIELELGIVSALRHGEFRLVYQPKVDGEGRIAGLEALIRWHSPTLGNVFPGEFIPAAESSALIRDITRFVVNEVCAFIRRTLDGGRPCPPVALNLSAVDVVRDDLLELIDESTARYTTPPELLEFEITETGLIGNEALAIHHLVELERRGNRIAIDDFGTGYSSLSKLSSFPVHAIKIDRSFVARIGTCEKSELIIKSIISLADMMSCTTVAEGVETAIQERFLKSVGCEVFQGYFYHRPLEVEQLTEVLALRAR